MPSLSQHQSNSIAKLLLIGDSGMGKTGALASLVEAGYNLRILDFDNGLDILKNKLLEKGKPELLEKVNFQTVTDPTRVLPSGQMIPTATAWTKAVKYLNNWPDGIGPLDKWTPNDILVLDSLSFAGKAAVRFVLNLNNKIADLPVWQDFYPAQQLLEKLCATLFSDSVSCNVIVISHIREVGKKQTVMDSKGRTVVVEEEGSRKGYPETGTGNALSPNIGRYFNAILMCDIQGSGQAARRIIRTIPHENIGLKNPAPAKLSATLPLETGLAQYFAAVRGEAPSNQGT